MCCVRQSWWPFNYRRFLWQTINTLILHMHLRIRTIFGQHHRAQHTQCIFERLACINTIVLYVLIVRMATVGCENRCSFCCILRFRTHSGTLIGPSPNRPWTLIPYGNGKKRMSILHFVHCVFTRKIVSLTSVNSFVPGRLLTLYGNKQKPIVVWLTLRLHVHVQTMKFHVSDTLTRYDQMVPGNFGAQFVSVLQIEVSPAAKSVEANGNADFIFRCAGERGGGEIAEVRRSGKINKKKKRKSQKVFIIRYDESSTFIYLLLLRFVTFQCDTQTYNEDGERWEKVGLCCARSAIFVRSAVSRSMAVAWGAAP